MSSTYFVTGLAALVLSGCSGGAKNDQARGQGAEDRGAAASDPSETIHAVADHEHAGEPVVLFNGSGTGLENLKIVYLRTDDATDGPADEVTIVVEVIGAPVTIIGCVRAADGAESPKVAAEALSEGRYHVHIGDLPAGSELDTSKAVLDFGIVGFTEYSLVLALPLGS